MSKTALIILAEDAEECEVVIPADVLRRADVQVQSRFQLFFHSLYNLGDNCWTYIGLYRQMQSFGDDQTG